MVLGLYKGLPQATPKGLPQATPCIWPGAHAVSIPLVIGSWLPRTSDPGRSGHHKWQTCGGSKVQKGLSQLPLIPQGGAPWETPEATLQESEPLR